MAELAAALPPFFVTAAAQHLLQRTPPGGKVRRGIWSGIRGIWSGIPGAARDLVRDPRRGAGFGQGSPARRGIRSQRRL
eukprot:4618420-Pyramimonas_sp.AAC.1